MILQQINPEAFGIGSDGTSLNQRLCPGLGGAIFDGDRPMRAEDLRAQAQGCHRLATGTLDATERQALVELASGLEHQAERLEKQQTAATNPS